MDIIRDEGRGGGKRTSPSRADEISQIVCEWPKSRVGLRYPDAIDVIYLMRYAFAMGN